MQRWLVLVLVPSLATACGAPGPRASSLRSGEPHEVAGDPFDDHMRALMARQHFRGGQVVVARGATLLLERVYGQARPGSAVTTSTQFRIASLSKSITAVLTHLLARDGRLDLDAPVLAHLGLEEQPTDPRWAQITARHLLEHAAGFDRHESRDWMFSSNFIAKELGQPGPPDLDAILAYVSRLPLDFEPGARYAYSNLGYAILGRVIESVTGMSYEEATRTMVLEPSGATAMRLGRTRPEHRPANETSYFPDPSEAELPSVYPGGGMVASPDGGFFLRPMAAHGGWIASAADVARFMSRVDGLPGPSDLLSAPELEQLLAEPTHGSFVGSDVHYGHGFFVVRSDEGRAWLHDGSKPGTTAFMMRTEEGLVMVALFNGRRTVGNPSQDIETTLRVAFDQITPPSTEASATAARSETPGE